MGTSVREKEREKEKERKREREREREREWERESNRERCMFCIVSHHARTQTMPPPHN
jgi:hypothetical protein